MGIMDRFKKTKPEQIAAETKPTKKTTKKVAASKVAAPKETAPEVVPVKAETVAAPIVTKTTNRILIKPVVTEKAASAQSGGKYTFIVANWAKKATIKTAVKEVYGIEPVTVNVVHVQGHRVRFGKNIGQHSDFKKAIVTLPPGKTITIHEGV